MRCAIYIWYRSGLDKKVKEFRDIRKLYEYIGRKYAGAIEPIYDIRYRVLTEREV